MQLNDIQWSKAPDTIANSINKSPLYPALAFIVEEVRKEYAGSKANSAEDLAPLLDKVCQRVGFEISPFERDEILTVLENDWLPFGPIQPLIDTPSISDIIIYNFNCIAIQQERKNFKTSISFINQSAYETFVEKILARAGATYSTKQPIADGTIDGLVRVHAIHKSLCESGPYLTIRVNRFSTVDIDDLIDSELAPREVFDYLRAIVLAGKTLLVAGEVGTGKTTLIRALASTIPHEQSVLVIEDTPEIRIEHPHVRYVSTRDENIEHKGRISPSQLIRAGMRMAMNRILFGEIRDAEAAEAFIDVCISGHPGSSTIHARSVAESIARLELFLARAQPGVGNDVLNEQIARAVNVIVHLDVCPHTCKRRIFEVRELSTPADGNIRQKTIFSYQHNKEKTYWKVVTKLSGFKEKIDPIIPLHTLPSEIYVGQ